MEAEIQTTLSQLGCTPKEVRLFIASFKHGPASIAELAKIARLQRSTAYVVAEQLIQKRLMIHDHSKSNKQIGVISPEQLIRKVEAKKRQFGRTSITLKEKLPELQAEYGHADQLPTLRSYKGKTGLVALWHDILTAKGEILLWTNQEAEQRLFDSASHHQFIRERVKRRIPIRVLAVHNPHGQLLIESDDTMLRATRLLPPGSSFSAETYLFDNKIAIIDYATDIFGVLIENSLIHQAQQIQFELAWQQTE